MPGYDNFYHHNRGSRCRYRHIVYSGCQGLILETQTLRMMIPLDKGTDIIELL